MKKKGTRGKAKGCRRERRKVEDLFQGEN